MLVINFVLFKNFFVMYLVWSGLFGIIIILVKVFLGVLICGVIFFFFLYIKIFLSENWWKFK